MEDTMDVKKDEQETVNDGAYEEASTPGTPANPNIHTTEGIFARQSRRVARSPCYYLLGCLFMAIALSALGMTVGEFSISANTGGWNSRGTLLANRETQSLIVSLHLEELFSGDDAVWTSLMNYVLPGWEDDDDDATESGRRLQEMSASVVPETWMEYLKPTAARTLRTRTSERPLELTPRLLQDLDSGLEDRGCDTTWYNSTDLTVESRLWPVWKTTSSSTSILDSRVLRDICIAESKTQEYLEKNKLCFGCDEGCLPPISIVMYARLVVSDGWSLSCEDLAEAWQPFVTQVQDEWTVCVKDVKNNFDPNDSEQKLPESCPVSFYTTFVEEFFDKGKSQYTSSIFATRGDLVEDLFDHVDKFDTAKSSSVVDGTYDTQYEEFNDFYIDISLVTDMALALGSALVVTIAILVKSCSLLITLIGVVQIILSFPLSFLFYNLVFQLDFFPFLNFIGIFVVFALGAGDIFVAVDKWNDARLASPDDASTEDIAAKAFPDAAGAMFLTTSTTAVAFFSTAVCPVAPITMFAIFCGLLILFDYIMNVLLVFPVLCVYDRALQRAKQDGRRVNCCISFTCCGLSKNLDAPMTSGESDVNKKEMALKDADGTHALDEELERTGRSTALESSRRMDDNGHSGSPKTHNEEIPQSLMTRILSMFYRGVHLIRWPLLVASMTAFGVCIYFSSTLELPTSSDVRLLNDKDPFEQNFLWRQKLLSTALMKAGGSQAYMCWGLKPADTGDHNNPGTFSELVLDYSFDSSSEDAQVFLKEFCEAMLEQDFAIPLDDEYTCPLTKFDSWLQVQSSGATVANATAEDAAAAATLYNENCNGATGIPMSSADWNNCIIAWSKNNNEVSILSRSDEVAIIFFPFLSRVRYDDPYTVLDKEWNMIEDWVQAENSKAPKGVHQGYFTSSDFWWYDTSRQMLFTAYSSAAMALGCAAFIILASSKSIILTLFCTITIGYILTSVTAMLVAIGWTLGFLESICFAILIGVSVDFCIHLAHAYASAAHGEEDREVRIKYALIHMGPSILATALTTVLSAVVMLFTVITFFQKFALILFLTVVQASIGSFIVFVVLADCFGPRNPTYLYDRMEAWWSSSTRK